MARTPFADKPLGSQEGEDVVHGQDEQVEEEGCGEEEEIILDDGAGFAVPHPRLSHPPTSHALSLLLRPALSAARSMRAPSKAWLRCSRTS